MRILERVFGEPVSIPDVNQLELGKRRYRISLATSSSEVEFRLRLLGTNNILLVFW